MFDALFGGKTETEKEIEEKRARMEYEREMFEAAQDDWLLTSGLVELMVEQTDSWAAHCGLDSWDDTLANLRTTGLDFDPRRPEHRRVLEYLIEQSPGDVLREMDLPCECDDCTSDYSDNHE